MERTIRAKFSNGVIRPLETINLAEDREIAITILEVPIPFNQKDGLEASSGGWKGLIDAEKLKHDIYADRLISTRPVIK